MQTTIADILRGLKVGQLQSVGVMQMIPLLLDDEDVESEMFLTPDKCHMATSDYGTLTGNNTYDEEAIIVPLNYALAVKERAQDHAMTTAGIILPKSNKVYNNAKCVQPNQCGTITPGFHDFSILPMPLRETAIKMINDHEMSSLWDPFSRFNNDMGVNDTDRDGGSGLAAFLRTFEDDLDTFIAQFEPATAQMGAVILIDGRIAGIERAPSRTYWKKIWSPIIRNCYGSMSIWYAKKKMDDPTKPPKTRIAIDPSRCGTIDLLMEEIVAVEAKEDRMVTDIVRNMISDDLKGKVEDSVNTKGYNHSVVTYSNKQIIGQTIQGNVSDAVEYASFIAKESWMNSAPWASAKPLTI